MVYDVKLLKEWSLVLIFPYVYWGCRLSDLVKSRKTPQKEKDIWFIAVLIFVIEFGIVGTIYGIYDALSG